jgi:16S rRNA processing protein RimM
MTPQTQEWVWLARIRRPQGRKGEVFAEILTDFPEKFAQRRQLWLLHEDVTDTRPHAAAHHGAESAVRGPADSPYPSSVQLTNHWLHKGGVVLHFAGVDAISAAETLAGLIVAIPREERARLAEDEVYIGDLIGCALLDVAQAEAPVTVGEIENVERGAGPAPILIVRGARGEVLVPFATTYLRRIDLERRRVEMALPEGLTDLNA